MKTECQCDACKSACSHKPGWFAPGEAERVAEFLKIPIKELFENYLMVDWWVGENDIYNLSPAIKGYEGGMAPARPTGKCIFFKNQKCSIHAVKPMECRDCFACDPPTSKGLHEKVGKMWTGEANQKQITDLLGSQPESETLSIFDMFGGF